MDVELSMTATPAETIPGSIEYNQANDANMGTGWYAYTVRTPLNMRQFMAELSSYLDIDPAQNTNFSWSGNIDQATAQSPADLYWKHPITGPRQYIAQDLIDFALTYTYDPDWEEPGPPSEFQAVKEKAATGQTLTDEEIQIALRGLLANT